MMKPTKRLNFAAILLLGLAAALFWKGMKRGDHGTAHAGASEPAARAERPRPGVASAVELPAPATLRDLSAGDWGEHFREAKVPEEIRGEILELAAELDQIAADGAAEADQLAYAEAIQVLLEDSAPGSGR